MSRNLLIIMSDEHQSRAMGCVSGGYVATPNLDALSRSSIHFENAYTNSPICVPSRASFATGRYVHDIGLWDNAMPFAGEPRGWGHALQEAGIRCESIGKLHYRSPNDDNGLDAMHMPMMVKGGVGMVWASVRDEADRVISHRRMLGERVGPGISDYYRYDGAITARARRWIRERHEDESDRPWCLFVGLVAPHFPLVVPDAYYRVYPHESLPSPKLHPADGYRRHPWIERQNAFMDSESRFRSSKERDAALASYYGLCTSLDHNIGQILHELARTRLDRQTTVIYTSDHGDNAGARGLWGKSNMYEESAAIPLILRSPDLAPGRCRTPASLVDLYPTILEHFGIARDERSDRPGTSLTTLALQDYDESRVVFSEYHAAGSVSGAFMIRKGDWKLIHYEGFQPELFNLAHDPEEENDLAGDRASTVHLQELYGELGRICDTAAVNRQAFRDQHALIESFGGKEKAKQIGAFGATPAPVATQ